MGTNPEQQKKSLTQKIEHQYSVFSPYVSPLQRFTSAARRVLARIHKVPASFSARFDAIYIEVVRPIYLLVNAINCARESLKMRRNAKARAQAKYASSENFPELPETFSKQQLRGETESHKIFRERAKLALSLISLGLNIAATVISAGLLNAILSGAYYVYSSAQHSYVYKKKSEALNAHKARATELKSDQEHRQLEIRLKNLDLKKTAERKIWTIRALSCLALAACAILFNFVPGGTFVVAGVYAAVALYQVIHSQKIRNAYKAEKAENLKTLELPVKEKPAPQAAPEPSTPQFMLADDSATKPGELGRCPSNQTDGSESISISTATSSRNLSKNSLVFGSDLKDAAKPQGSEKNLSAEAGESSLRTGVTLCV